MMKYVQLTVIVLRPDESNLLVDGTHEIVGEESCPRPGEGLGTELVGYRSALIHPGQSSTHSEDIANRQGIPFG